MIGKLTQAARQLQRNHWDAVTSAYIQIVFFMSVEVFSWCRIFFADAKDSLFVRYSLGSENRWGGLSLAFSLPDKMGAEKAVWSQPGSYIIESIFSVLFF